MRKTMTNEQKLLAYLYTVPSIKRKELAVALPDMSYQCLTRAVRTALEHGYVEYITVAKCRAVRLTAEGKRYIRSAAGDSLDKARRRAATVNGDTEGKRRFERRETARNLCRAAGIFPAAERGISFGDVLCHTEKGNAFFAGDFPGNGLFFQSDDVSRSIRVSGLAKEEVTSTGSRYVGLILNNKGLFIVYNTLDKLMRFPEHPEMTLLNGLTSVLNDCGSFGTQDRKGALRNISAIVIGKSDAMLPKIYRGTKWGVADNQRVPNPVTKNLLSLENLHRHFTRTYLIPATTLGVDLLHRTACLPFTLVERMKEQWFAEHGHYTVLRSNGYLEAYEEGTRVKTVLFPVLSFEELAYHAAKGERVHVICERGTGEGISRVLGPIVESMRDFDAKPILFHRYDEAGVRMDGENPLTHHGYLAAEEQG